MTGIGDAEVVATNQAMNQLNHLDEKTVIARICTAFPDIEAIYLFGSFADGSQDQRSDLALLLRPPHDQYESRNLFLHPLHGQLQELTGRNVDLLNLRQMTTVLQKEVVMLGRRIHCPHELAADQFDIDVLSRYQKLNQERAEIMQAFENTGRAYDV
jgi:predicted nucleotidyltransferase